jgi:regulatory protein YycI of two-component signal transduction system YycFG
MSLEWKRAITILIASFVVLNIFMAFNLWFREKPIAEFVLTSNQKSEIQQSLSQRGVILKVDIPKEGRPQSLLEVSFRKVDEKKVLEGFFGKKAVPKVIKTQDGRNYTYNNQQLIITDNGFITYFNTEDSIIWPNLTKEQAESEAVNFMISHGGMPENAVLDKVTYDDQSKGFLLEYVRYYDDFFIENSYVTMLVTPSGIKTFYQCWLDPLGYVGKKRVVISPLTAIMRVITEAKIERQIEITRIQQGYYSKLYDADRWQAAPVWRIQLGDVDTYYVNAYTGEMEQ